MVQVASHHEEDDMLAKHDSVFEMPLTSVTTVRAGMPAPRKYIPLARLPDLVDETVNEARFEAKVRPVATVPDDTAVIASVVLAEPPVPAVNVTVPSDDVIVVPAAIV